MTDSGARASESPDFAALSEAGRAFARSERRTPTGRDTSPSYVLPIVASILVGTMITFAGGFRYRCVATIRPLGSASDARLTLFRKELLDFAWDEVRQGQLTDHAAEPPWFIETTGDGSLRVGLISTNRTLGMKRVSSLASGFKRAIDAQAATRQATPTEAEDLLSASLDDLRSRLDDAEHQVETVLAQLPDDDPSDRRGTMRDRWQALRGEFDSTRSSLMAASGDMARLGGLPEPAQGVITEEARRAAYDADDALRHDLRELAVNLTEMKLHILTVWQTSAAPLEELGTASRELLNLVRTAEPPSGGDHPSNPAQDSVAAYVEDLEAFSQTWTREFTALRATTVDAQRCEVLEVFQRSRRQLTDFLFTAGRHLTAIRSAVRAAQSDPTDSARHHVAVSNLVRSFQALEAIHHRFEFGADAIEPANNFRLDAAIQTARGLRRRTRARMGEIETRLAATALEQARKHYHEELTAARDVLADARQTADQTVARLVALQDELNIHSDLTEDFLRSTLRAEIAGTRLDLTRREYAKTEAHLRSLAEKRRTSSESSGVEIVAGGVDGGPVNLIERLRTGGLTGLLTLLSILVGQWWTARRPTFAEHDRA